MSYDAFLYFADTIKGESQDKVYKDKNAIEVHSFSWGVSNPSTVGHGSGMGSGKVSISSLSIMKRVDTASTDLALCSAKGTHLSKATLVLRKSGGTPVEYYTAEMSEVMIDSVQWSGSTHGDDYPTESVSIAFGSIKVTYKEQKADGSAGASKEFGWSVVTNTAI
jgi:type VI secretion system secreted protein Hcp